jgi:regulator of protease activity HflC (stomatin/prohibitin superfamily)
LTDIETLKTLLRPQRYHHVLVDALIIALLTIGVVSLLLWHTFFVMVPAGSVGVLFRLFGDGTETRFHYTEGLAVKWPWDSIHLYDMRTQARDWHASVLTYNGLTVQVDYTELFRPEPNEIGMLHKDFGPDYYERMIQPLTVQALRSTISEFNPHQLYTTDVFALSQRVLEMVLANVSRTHVEIEGIVVRRVELPDELVKAIDEKLRQQQLAQAYEYRIVSAQREAERKRIEAIGIRNFYSIVSDSLTPSLLTWRGIEATTDLARSPNSKVVIVGGGKDQLPLILGSDINNLPNPGQAVPPAGADANPLPDWKSLKPIFPDDQDYGNVPGSDETSSPASPADKRSARAPGGRASGAGQSH